MTGAVLLNQLNQILSEINTTFIDRKTSFDYLYEGAKDFAKETNSCTNSQSIVTVANQSAYNLNPDFLEILTKDSSNFPTIMLTWGNSPTYLGWESYSDYLQGVIFETAGMPTSFCITDAGVLPSEMGVCSGNFISIGGESFLTTGIADFSSVYPGDAVINLTKNYYGIVIGTVSSKKIKTAMFSLQGRNSSSVGWDLSDEYIIQPAPRFQVLLDPAPILSGQTVTVSYNSKPLPVYSDYGSYSFASGYESAIVKYAAWLYKYRDKKPAFGDPFFMAYERDMRKAKSVNRKARGATGFRVNLIRRGM